MSDCDTGLKLLEMAIRAFHSHCLKTIEEMWDKDISALKEANDKGDLVTIYKLIGKYFES